MDVTLRQIRVQTNGAGHFAEITRDIDRCVQESGASDGVALIRSRHTTAAITCNEPDPRLHEDMRDAVYYTFPLSRRYRHIEEGADNAVAHLATAMLFGESTWLPIRDGRIDLGTWQHVYLVELYEARVRLVDVAILGSDD